MSNGLTVCLSAEGGENGRCCVTGDLTGCLLNAKKGKMLNDLKVDWLLNEGVVKEI